MLWCGSKARREVVIWAEYFPSGTAKTRDSKANGEVIKSSYQSRRDGAIARYFYRAILFLPRSPSHLVPCPRLIPCYLVPRPCPLIASTALRLPLGDNNQSCCRMRQHFFCRIRRCGDLASLIYWYSFGEVKTKGRFDEPLMREAMISRRPRIIASPRHTNVDSTEVVGIGKEPYITVKPT